MALSIMGVSCLLLKELILGSKCAKPSKFGNCFQGDFNKPNCSRARVGESSTRDGVDSVRARKYLARELMSS
ncbi:hypothetical protein OROGR_005123 [Orobanche gracilis]